MTARELPAKKTPVAIPELYLAVRLQLEPLVNARRAEQGKGAASAEELRAATVIMLAQMALETGRFKSISNYNLGGIKCPKSWAECYQHFTTREHFAPPVASKYMAEAPAGTKVQKVGEDADGKWILSFSGPHPMNRFVAFETLADAVAHHCAFMVGKPAPDGFREARYVEAVDAALANDPLAFVTKLRDKGYFTADPKVYSKNVASIAREYAKLVPDTAPAAPTRPVEALVSLAATVPAPEPEAARVEAPAAPGEPAPVTPPPVAPVDLPRIGEPLAQAHRPWWIRLLVWLGRVLVRRPLP